jgi:hypothetical protein
MAGGFGRETPTLFLLGASHRRLHTVVTARTAGSCLPGVRRSESGYRGSVWAGTSMAREAPVLFVFLFVLSLFVTFIGLGTLLFGPWQRGFVFLVLGLWHIVWSFRAARIAGREK